MKTKILFISSNTNVGGQEVVLKRMLQRLDGDLYQKDVFITHGIKGPLHDAYEQHSDSLYYHMDDAEGARYSALLQKIRENKYDILHFFNLYVVWDVIPRIWRLFPKIKIIVTLFVEISYHRSVFSKEFKLLEKIMPRLWACTSDSHINKELHPEITLIRNGVPVDIFKPAEKEPKTVAWVSRFISYKRADIVPEIARQMPDYHFIMIGDRKTKEYNEIIGDCPPNLEIRIGLTEEEVAEVLARSQYFLFASISESMPITIYEAMASECCVVTEDVGDISSIIKNGVNGYLMPRGGGLYEGENLVNWVTENLPLLDTSVAKTARQNVLDEFTFDQMMKRYEFLYGEMGSHGDQMRVAFLWDEPMYDVCWGDKIDAYQETIARLSRDHVVQIHTTKRFRSPVDHPRGREIINGQNIVFVDYRLQKDFIYELKRFKPDLIFMNAFHKALWRRVVTAFPQTWKAVKHFGSDNLTLWIAKLLDMIIVQQEYLRKPIAELNYFPLGNVAVTPFGVRTDIFNPGFCKKEYTGIMVGDFREEVKRQHLLIEAWKHIPGRLCLLGRFDRSDPSDYHEKCMEHARFLGVDGRIDFIDGIKHEMVPDLIRKAKIAFLTSAWEGGSIALLEMMACGLPAVVLHDCPGNINRIRPGIDGVVTGGTAPTDIAKATNKLLNGDWRKMGTEASKRVLQEFPYGEKYDFYRDLIKTVMGKKCYDS